MRKMSFYDYAENIIENSHAACDPMTGDEYANDIRKHAAHVVDLLFDESRKYHNHEHVVRTLALLEAFRNDAFRFLGGDARWHMEAARFALLYHDAIYVPGRSDNETKSAELAESVLTSIYADTKVITAVVAAIKATDYTLDEAVAVPASLDINTRVVVELVTAADLAPLDAHESVVIADSTAVLQENACWPPTALTLARRRAFLIKIMGTRMPLFLTGCFPRMCANIEASDKYFQTLVKNEQ